MAIFVIIIMLKGFIMKVKHISAPARMRVCAICGKTASSGYNRPHSLHRTKKTIKPNLQPRGNVLICTRCLRTIKNKGIKN